MAQETVMKLPDPPAGETGDLDAAGERGKEALLLDSRQVLNIICAMGESLIVLSPDAEIWFVNKATENLLGCVAGELVGKAIGTVVADDDLEFFSALRDMITKGPIRNYRLNYLASGARSVPVSLNGSALREESTGRLLGMVLVARDMRDLMGLVKELEGARDSLEEKVRARTDELEKANTDIKSAHAQLLQSEKMASIGQLAAGVAHEINNPVGFLLSNLGTIESYMKDLLALVGKYDELLGSVRSRGVLSGTEFQEIDGSKKDLDLDFILSDAVQVIRESVEGAERVRKIVADLRDFSHADSTEFTYADINRGIESTLNIASNEIKYKATVRKDFGELPRVKCSPGELNQVFMNLIVNAGQAIEGNGEINIRTYHEGARVFIEISDTGCGIPEESIKRIFDPFFTTKPVGEGTGLGLALSYNIVKGHDGEITVRSAPGKGTTFTVSLPVGKE